MMPIRPEMRRRYPPRREWLAICARIRARATGPDGLVRCEDCLKAEGTRLVTVWDGTGRWRLEGSPEWDWFGLDGEPADQPRGVELHRTVVVLATTHNNHQPEDVRDDNLRLRCRACHLRHDRPVQQFLRGETLRLRPDQLALAIGPVQVVRPAGVPEP